LLEENGNAKKICINCNEEKNINLFYFNKTRNSFFKSCKSCENLRKKKKCNLCNIEIDEKFIQIFNPKNYTSIHGFCRQCRKKLRVYQKKYGGKRCTKCEILKPFGDFPFHKKTYDTFDSWCKTCRKKYNYECKQSLDTHIRHRLRSILDDRRKHEVLIDLQYLVNLWEKQNGKCAISNVQMTHQRTKRIQNQTNASLDRIDSSKGYIPGNVQWLCWTVNRMKGEHNLEELRDWCQKILNNFLS
jgi:hypothetical protein